jgi:hypothetical protein
MRQKSSGRSTGPLMSPVSTSSPFNSNNANLAHLNRSGDVLDPRNGPSSGRSDRPTLSSLPAAQSEINIRNGFQSRQLTPQPHLAHAPASFPPPGASPTTFSQGGLMIQTPQPRLPPPPPVPHSSNSDHHHHQASDRDVTEWTTGSQRPPQLPPLPPSSRPTSAGFIRAGGGDLTPSTPTYTPSPNGHGPVTPVQLRQRS